MPRDQKPRKTEPKPRRRALRRIGWILLALLIVVGAALLWIFNTQSGARFVLARVQSALDNKLSVGTIGGTLAGPLQLDDVRYVDAAGGVDARIKHASIDLDVLDLLGRRVSINTLAANDVDIALTTVAPKPETASPFSLTAPIDILVNQLALERATITQDGKPLLVVDRLDLIGGWTQDGVLVKKLTLRSPDGSVDLNGNLATLNGYSGDGETTFAWRAGETDLAGVIKSHSDGKQARLEVTLTKPTAATATVTIAQTATAAWNLQLEVPTFDAKKILPDSTLGVVALHLQGSGDRGHGNLSGTGAIDTHQFAIDPLQVAWNDGIVTIDSLHLTTPESIGALDLTGTINIANNPLSANLKANWKDIELPEDLVGQPLATHGELAIDGSIDLFSAKGALALGPPGALADIDLDISGTGEVITLNTVRLKQADGGLDARGTISLQPVLGWKI
ncbi:MAG: pathogenicity protein, partial [Dokdonella sp.]